ncbi:hypothetical protein GCM10009541_11360 [Micromonospora gifhornensis]|uniref:Uncharacterized protein n=1 Tax=Micromonospora gifhornensis TaxID=84594 RepID=A0ABQ4IES9_9ACTN|nr:glycosyltransferase family 4 protein [Micromonospora gifhornensis]GIJ16326.1 hypothetical protein Vgi01_30100 [Micromonospora gifhornensis]
MSVRTAVDRQLTVAVFTPWYPEPERPWDGTFVANQCDALRDLGVRIRVFKLTRDGLTARMHEIDPADRTAVPHTRRRILGAHHLASLVHRGRLWSEPVDAVLAEGVWASSLLRRVVAPMVVVLHGRAPMTASGARTDPVRRRIIAGSLRRAQALVAVGPDIVDDLPPELRAGCHVVPNGVLLDAFAPRGGSTFERLNADDFPRFVTVGNVDTNKNQETLLRAFAAIRDRWPAASWWVVGDGPERHRLEGLRDQLGHGDRIHFTGRIAPDEVAKVLGESDLFVLPSRTEAFGCVYLEAMAVGVPTLVSRSAGLAALVDDDRYLHDPDDSRQLLAKADAILSTPAQYEQAVAFGHALAEGCTWQAHAESLVDVLTHSVLNKKAVTAP